MIIGELCKAEEAFRCGRFAFYNTNVGRYDENDWKDVDGDPEYFEIMVKNTHEDHIAMALIRLFDLAGYLVPEENYPFISSLFDLYNPQYDEIKNIGSWFYSIVIQANSIKSEHHRHIIPCGVFGEILGNIFSGCELLNIPIGKHIDARLAYMRSVKE